MDSIGAVVALAQEVEQRTVTIDWCRQEQGHLTLALIEAEWQLGKIGIVCDWPRADRLRLDADV